MKTITWNGCPELIVGRKVAIEKALQPHLRFDTKIDVFEDQVGIVFKVERELVWPLDFTLDALFNSLPELGAIETPIMRYERTSCKIEG